MGDGSAIGWLGVVPGRRPATWNPAYGCTPKSEGCSSCYARGIHQRFRPGEPFEHIRLHPDVLDRPAHWRAPRMILAGSMTDLFHPAVPESFIGSVFRAMAETPRHLYVILTKRPDRAADLLTSRAQTGLWRCHDGTFWQQLSRPLPNLWLGTSVEDQAAADERLPHLFRAPAARRIVSCEPLLGPVDLVDWLLDGWTCPRCGQRHLQTIGKTCVRCGQQTWPLPYARLDWVITGGETGPKARPARPDWFRSLRDQCQNTRVPFYLKSLGEWTQAPWKLQRAPGESDVEYKTRSGEAATHAFTGGYHTDAAGNLVEGFVELGHQPWSSERDQHAPGGALGMRRAGKKRAGRDLDGRTWDEHPEAPC